MKNRSYTVRLIGLTIVAVVVVCVTPFLGIRWIWPSELFTHDEYRRIFFAIRAPRTITAFFAGGGLAVAGMAYQAIFRNPLACPYTLGVSGGASLGAALCIVAGVGGSFLGISLTTIGAFIGAATSILLVYVFAWSKESNSTTLLLAGVVVASVCSGLIMFVYFLSPLQHSFQIMRWIMGGVDGTDYLLFTIMIIPLTAFLFLTAILIPQLDQFLTGDDIAHSRGVNVHLSRNIFLVTTALAVGAIVAVCGPIGFVGIIAPHACRMLLPGTRHRLLAVCSFLAGGIFLTLSDTIARILMPPVEIPVGIITALFGGPFFLTILFKKKNRLLM